LKFFLDNNLSPYLARALHTLLEPEGDQVIHLIDRFARDIKDRAWIEALAAEGGWVIISADRRIHRNRLEREAWRRSRLVVFFLGPQWRRLRNIEIAWRLLPWWPRIEEQARLVMPPAAFELPRDYRTGRLRVLRASRSPGRGSRGGYPGFRARRCSPRVCQCAFVFFPDFPGVDL
jgi:hypothetical protein